MTDTSAPKDTIPDEHVEQIARYMQARDARSFGVKTDDGWSPTWEDSGQLGREDYLRDANAFLHAAAVLGYKHSEPQLADIDRIDVIGPAGRVLGLLRVADVQTHVQDDGHTLKVIFDGRTPTEGTL